MVQVVSKIIILMTIIGKVWGKKNENHSRREQYYMAMDVSLLGAYINPRFQADRYQRNMDGRVRVSVHADQIRSWWSLLLKKKNTKTTTTKRVVVDVLEKLVATGSYLLNFWHFYYDILLFLLSSFNTNVVSLILIGRHCKMLYIYIYMRRRFFAFWLVNIRFF